MLRGFEKGTLQPFVCCCNLRLREIQLLLNVSLNFSTSCTCKAQSTCPLGTATLHMHSYHHTHWALGRMLQNLQISTVWFLLLQLWNSQQRIWKKSISRSGRDTLRVTLRVFDFPFVSPRGWASRADPWHGSIKPTSCVNGYETCNIKVYQIPSRSSM